MEPPASLQYSSGSNTVVDERSREDLEVTRPDEVWVADITYSLSMANRNAQKLAARGRLWSIVESSVDGLTIYGVHSSRSLNQ